MGQKGDKNTHTSNLNAEEFCAKLESIDGISSKRMFGGNGIFHDGKMFGIIDSKGQAYLKASDATKTKFESMRALKHGKMPYYTIPPKVSEHIDLLLEWAETSIASSK